jgi:hypothetical protein
MLLYSAESGDVDDWTNFTMVLRLKAAAMGLPFLGSLPSISVTSNSSTSSGNTSSVVSGPHAPSIINSTNTNTKKATAVHPPSKTKQVKPCRFGANCYSAKYKFFHPATTPEEPQDFPEKPESHVPPPFKKNPKKKIKACRFGGNCHDPPVSLLSSQIAVSRRGC